MAQSNPLAGLTGEEADAAIDRLAAKVAAAEENLKAAKAHLKAMKAARRDLDEPSPAGDGTAAHAQPATITTEASGQ